MQMRYRILAVGAVNVVALVVVALAAFAWGYDGRITITGIRAGATRLFGALPTAGLMALVVMSAIGLALSANWLFDKGRKKALIALLLVSVFLSGFGLWGAVTMPSSAIWTFIGLVGVAALLALAAWGILTAGSISVRVPGWARFRTWRHARRAPGTAAPAAASSPSTP